MRTKDDMRRRLKEQLAIEYNCLPEDLDRDRADNVITLPALHPGRRKYSDKPHFLTMVTMGGNAVISADERLHPFLREWVKNRSGFWLFEQDNLRELERELERYGKTLRPTHHMFLPKTEPLDIQPEFEVKWFEKGGMEAFYGDERFPNAVCQPKDENRPDVLAVAAVIDGRIAGLAGCSADAEEWWQIGIDVLPEYQSRGMGAALVGLLKDEVLRRGKLPFYGTSLSNLHSWNIALKCGFYPAWVELETAGDN